MTENDKIKAYLFKSLSLITNIIVHKKATPGTRSKRKDGIYEKQSDGTWKKVSGKKESKEELPKDITQMTPEQNRKVVDLYKKKYSEKQLDKKIEQVEGFIKQKEQQLEHQGIDFRKNPDADLKHLQHNKMLYETARQEKRESTIR